MQRSPSAQTKLAVPLRHPHKRFSPGSLKYYSTTVKFTSLIMMQQLLLISIREKKIGDFVC